MYLAATIYSSVYTSFKIAESKTSFLCCYRKNWSFPLLVFYTSSPPLSALTLTFSLGTWSVTVLFSVTDFFITISSLTHGFFETTTSSLINGILISVLDCIISSDDAVFGVVVNVLSCTASLSFR